VSTEVAHPSDAIELDLDWFRPPIKFTDIAPERASPIASLRPNPFAAPVTMATRPERPVACVVRRINHRVLPSVPCVVEYCLEICIELTIEALDISAAFICDGETSTVQQTFIKAPSAR
jgi:hypothetical protein